MKSRMGNLCICGYNKELTLSLGWLRQAQPDNLGFNLKALRWAEGDNLEERHKKRGTLLLPFFDLLIGWL
jgi:hypothetical protein